jgi:hypothetical protein
MVIVMNATTEIGSSQVSGSVRDLAAYQLRFERLEFVGEFHPIHDSVDGVAGFRVGELELQQILGRVRGARAT